MALINTILADKLPVLQHDEKGYYYIDADKRVDTYFGSLIVFHGEYFQISFNDLKWHKIDTSRVDSRKKDKDKLNKIGSMLSGKTFTEMCDRIYDYCEELTSGE